MSDIERFMAVDPEHGVALEICRVPAGLRFTVHGSSVVSAWVDPKHAPAIARSVIKAAGIEAIILPMGAVPKVEDLGDGDLRCGRTDVTASASAGWARARAAELAAIAEHRDMEAAREAAEKAEAEAAERKLQERRDALAAEFAETWGLSTRAYMNCDGPLRTAITRIIELEDGASRD